MTYFIILSILAIVFNGATAYLAYREWKKLCMFRDVTEKTISDRTERIEMLERYVQVLRDTHRRQTPGATISTGIGI